MLRLLFCCYCLWMLFVFLSFFVCVRTDTSYEDSMIAKDFVFIFINSFSSFFFLGMTTADVTSQSKYIIKHWLLIYCCFSRIHKYIFLCLLFCSLLVLLLLLFVICICFEFYSHTYICSSKLYVPTAFFASSLPNPTGDDVNTGQCGYPTCMSALAINLGIILGTRLTVNNAIEWITPCVSYQTISSSSSSLSSSTVAYHSLAQLNFAVT